MDHRLAPTQAIGYLGCVLRTLRAFATRTLKKAVGSRRVETVHHGLRLTEGLLEAVRDRNRWSCLAIHRRTITKAPPSLVIPLIAGHLKGRGRCPENLTIFLIHDYPTPPIAVQALRYIGIERFVELTPPPLSSWRNSIKLVAMRDWFARGGPSTPYVLFLDADDVVLRDAPQRALMMLEESEAEMLVSSTRFTGGFECMPDCQQRSNAIAEAHGAEGTYMNTGVYIARTTFLRELVERLMPLVTDEDLTREQYRSLRFDGKLCETLPEYPKGVGCDQVLMRSVYPELYPRMKVDYRGQLALR